MSDSNSSAGLTFAPPYDPTQELDPDTAEVVRQEPDLSELRYFKEAEQKRTLRARVGLLALIFTMLAGNMWLTWASQSAIQANVDQTRLDQVALTESVESQVGALRAQNEALRVEITALRAEVAALSAPADAAAPAVAAR